MHRQYTTAGGMNGKKRSKTKMTDSVPKDQDTQNVK